MSRNICGIADKSDFEFNGRLYYVGWMKRSATYHSTWNHFGAKNESVGVENAYFWDIQTLFKIENKS